VCNEGTPSPAGRLEGKKELHPISKCLPVDHIWRRLRMGRPCRPALSDWGSRCRPDSHRPKLTCSAGRVAATRASFLLQAWTTVPSACHASPQRWSK